MGCATVPKATVEMSVLLEQQIESLKEGNRLLINSVFDAKEQNMIDYLDNALFPTYLTELFANEQIQLIWNEMVESNEVNDRIEVMTWLNTNIQEVYRVQKDSLLAPIATERDAILTAFDNEYSKALQMNSSITRNISSINELNEVYSELTSNVIDQTKLDSLVNASIQYIDTKLDAIQSGVDIYEEGKDTISNIVETIK